MIAVTFDRLGVEDQQPIRETGVGCGDHLIDELGLTQFTQGPIRAVSHLVASRAEQVHGRREFSPAQRSEVSRSTLQRPGLTMGQAQHLDLDLDADKRPGRSCSTFVAHKSEKRCPAGSASVNQPRTKRRITNLLNRGRTLF
jgi:hypothetical protein